MKKIICLTSMFFLMITANVSASLLYDSGPYVGGQYGWGRINEGDAYKKFVIVDNSASAKIDLGTWRAWRVYGGFSFIPFFSIEGGYTHYPPNEYSNTNGYIENETYGVDLVGKVILPFEIIGGPLSQLSIYGKGGFTYLNTKIKALVTGTNSISINKTTGSLRPIFGAGLIFNFTDNIAVDLTWTATIGKTRVNPDFTDATRLKDAITSGHPIPSSHMYTIGISYKVTGIF